MIQGRSEALLVSTPGCHKRARRTTPGPSQFPASDCRIHVKWASLSLSYRFAR
jgi:hypothetical protein